MCIKGFKLFYIKCLENVYVDCVFLIVDIWFKRLMLEEYVILVWVIDYIEFVSMLIGEYINWLLDWYINNWKCEILCWNLNLIG